MTPPMPSANLIEAYFSSPTILYFFSGLHLPKLQKPQNKIKQNFLPTPKNK
jgi:hypothetical protein